MKKKITQTILNIVAYTITAAILWGAYTLVELNERLTRAETQMEFLLKK